MSHPNILLEFITFTDEYNKHKNDTKRLVNKSMIKRSLQLLDNLPQSRELVLEYYGNVAEISVQNYANNVEIDPQTGLQLQDSKEAAAGGAGAAAAAGGNNSTAQLKKQQQLAEDDTFALIQEKLESWVLLNPPDWVVTIAIWGIDLIAHLSNKYKRKLSLQSMCNYWLNCNTMHGLTHLVSMCFPRLNNAQVELVVERMLVAFRKYRQYFDWATARLAGCFPLKIITQVLQLGLKRFLEDPNTLFQSEIGILDYLLQAHEQELKMALRELLQQGFEPKKHQDAVIVPYLMCLSNNSDELLQILVIVFIEMYNDELRATIVQKAPLWLSNKMFADMQPSLNYLALRLKFQGVKLLMKIAQMSEEHRWCLNFLESSLQQLEQTVLKGQTCALMLDLCSEDSKKMLWKACLSHRKYEQQTAVRLLLLISTQQPRIYAQTIAQLLSKSYVVNTNGIGPLVRIICGQSGVVEFPSIDAGLKSVLTDIWMRLKMQLNQPAQSLEDDSEACLNAFQNLNKLTKMQKRNCFPKMKPQLLTNALNAVLPAILDIADIVLNKLVLVMNKRATTKTSDSTKQTSEIEMFVKIETINSSTKRPKTETMPNFDDIMDNPIAVENHEYEKNMNLVHTIFDLLNTIEVAAKGSVLSTEVILKLATLSVKYFFVLLTEQNMVKRAAAQIRIFDLLKRQCLASKAARSCCLRELVEGAIIYYGYLFQQAVPVKENPLAILESEKLLVQNQKHILGPNTTRSVLHAGVIGSGLKTKHKTLAEDCDPERQTLLLKALDACCIENDKQTAVGDYSVISLLLVEIVSPDVMNNGLPFPDDEFLKVTMERDLAIRRVFDNIPILWALVSFLAEHRPALCYSSVLVRALLASCLHQWRAKNVNKFEADSRSDGLMHCTKLILQVLTMGQLLPPPLSSLHIIIEHFEPAEIALLLKESVWNYLREYVPTPQLFQVVNNVFWRNPQTTQVPAKYVDILRHLMQKKLSKLGTYYYQMFILPVLHGPAAAAAQVAPAQTVENEMESPDDKMNTT